jgi:MoxR-like ATPase
VTDLSPAFRLQSGVVAPLKSRFVGRDEVVDLIALAITAGEHLFLHGPPGTAKSALIRAFAGHVGGGRYFEYLLTKFSEPTELFGPVDLARLREGVVTTVTTGMLPEAEFVFLDELFNANSAILNNLLAVLNERVFRRGAETFRLPLLSVFAASNRLPEDDALAALFDRFLLRCHVGQLSREAVPGLLAAGWALERGANGDGAPAVCSGELRELSRAVLDVDLSAVTGPFAEAVFRVRDLGVALSDRRAVKVLKLVAASAVLCGRTAATTADFWVLRYVWDREEQAGPLAALVNGLLESAPTERAHPRAAVPERIDGEELARELDAAEAELGESPPGMAALARLREKVGSVADRAAWVTDAAAREHLTDRAGRLLGRIGP